MTPTSGLDAVRGWVADARRIVVFTGAGISTDSGIPDFRGPQGIWTKNPGAERRAHISHYLADADIRAQVWRSRAESPAWTSRPNAGHRAIVALERQGRLHALVTQNIDGLHQLAGNDPAGVVELHGTMREVTCLDCGDRGPAESTLNRVRAGEADPHCLRCGGILKSATVSFGQSLDPDDLGRAVRAALECDLLLAVGSTLTVSPANQLVPLAQRMEIRPGSNGRRTPARVVIVNAEPTFFDNGADAVIRLPISQALPALIE
ncbi:MAG: Sir2 family NAD-dependent protein deacetylase [Actinomycetota bacterium]|nr:Sir2 family NAD-dependent protein deacetylase [Actinomycetota bacterium]